MRHVGAVLLAVLVAMTVIPSLVVGPGYATGTVVVRIVVTNAVMPDEDWMMDTLIAGTTPETSHCRAEARSPHARYVTPRNVEMALRFNGTSLSEACLGASYDVTVWAYVHADDRPIDVNGTHPGGLGTYCRNQPGNADTVYCRLVVAFDFSGQVKTDHTDGADDGNNEPGVESNGAFDYRIEIAASSIASVPSQGYVPKLVRVFADSFVLGFPPAADEDDYNYDGDVRSSAAACSAEGRSLHSRFFVPAHMDLLIRDGAACPSTVKTRVIPYTHYGDAPLDINGTVDPVTVPPTRCPLTFQGAGAASQCWLDLSLAVTDGVSPTAYADGSKDGNGGADEHDANLTYRVGVWNTPKNATVHVGFRLTPPNVADDWLVDGQAQGTGSECLARARTGHSRFAEPTMLDLVFRGDSPASCFDNAITIKLIAYLHGADNLLDINPVADDGGCNAAPNPDPPFTGCTLTIVWTPTAELSGVANGADDHLAGGNDASITYTIGGY